MNIDPKSITCINKNKYGYKYALHCILNECYEHKRNVLFITFDSVKLEKQIALWQTYNNKYLDFKLIHNYIGYVDIFNMYKLLEKNIGKHNYAFNNKMNLIIFHDFFCNEAYILKSPRRCINYIDYIRKNMHLIYNNHEDLIKNYNNFSIIFMNNFDYDHEVINFLKKNVTNYIECTVNINILICKVGDLNIFYEINKIKGHHKVIARQMTNVEDIMFTIQCKSNKSPLGLITQNPKKKDPKIINTLPKKEKVECGGLKWTENEINQLYTELRNHVTLKEISTIHKRTNYAIEARIRNLIVKRSKNGENIVEIATDLCLDESYVQKILSKAYF